MTNSYISRDHSPLGILHKVGPILQIRMAVIFGFANTPSCRIGSDRQTTSLTLTTGVCEAGRKMRSDCLGRLNQL